MHFRATALPAPRAAPPAGGGGEGEGSPRELRVDEGHTYFTNVCFKVGIMRGNLLKKYVILLSLMYFLIQYDAYILQKSLYRRRNHVLSSSPSSSIPLPPAEDNESSNINNNELISISSYDKLIKYRQFY